MILCECGDFVGENTFRDYIKTSSNPSTPTIGHIKCGLIFDFVDGICPKRYSSRKELKGIAMKYACRRRLTEEKTGCFLLEVDRLKSKGRLTDIEIILEASRRIKSGMPP